MDPGFSGGGIVKVADSVSLRNVRTAPSKSSRICGRFVRPGASRTPAIAASTRSSMRCSRLMRRRNRPLAIARRALREFPGPLSEDFGGGFIVFSVVMRRQRSLASAPGWYWSSGRLYGVRPRHHDPRAPRGRLSAVVAWGSPALPFAGAGVVGYREIGVPPAAAHGHQQLRRILVALGLRADIAKQRLLLLALSIQKVEKPGAAADIVDPLQAHGFRRQTQRALLGV